MSRRRLAPLASALLAGAFLAPGCSRQEGRPASAPAAAAAPLVTDAPPPRRAATLLWPGAEAEGLVARDAEIFATRDPADQARQVVGLLLAAPPDDAVAAPLPAGTRLLALFIDERGTAFVDVSREAASGSGGSAWELLAVHSLCGSLVRSVPQVRRMQLLVEGRQVETLAGHLDLRAPTTFDEGLLAK